MRSLIFDKICLISRKEQTARIESFHPSRTAIIGENRTGKSSLIKSLYSALGADPTKNHPSWKALDVESLLFFSVDRQPFRIYRAGSLFGLFDSNDKLISKESSIVKGLAPKLAELFDFKLQLRLKKTGESVVPPPAFCFLPFYMDQDESWSKSWSSFRGLGMMHDYKRDAAYYHCGLRPNAYYVAKAEKHKYDDEKSSALEEWSALERAAVRLDLKKGATNFALAADQFSSSISNLLSEIERIQHKQDEQKNVFANLCAERSLLREQIDIAKSALAELDKDYKFARKINEDILHCPTCGTAHANDFVNKFALLSDVEECREFIISSEQIASKLNVKISRAQEELVQLDREAIELKEILSDERGGLKLQDLLQQEGQRIASNAFSEEMQIVEKLIGSSEASSKNALEKMKSFESKEHQDKILTTYRQHMKKYLSQLGVTKLDEQSYRRIDATISETGSAGPRALLAYYFAILQTIAAHSSSVRCPIVIDSPLQQDPDDENKKRIIQFIADNTPNGFQLILGSGGLHGVKLDAKEIRTTEIDQLLGEDQYDRAASIMSPYLDAMFA